jgi:hypothetical protein
MKSEDGFTPLLTTHLPHPKAASATHQQAMRAPSQAHHKGCYKKRNKHSSQVDFIILNRPLNDHFAMASLGHSLGLSFLFKGQRLRSKGDCDNKVVSALEIEVEIQNIKKEIEYTVLREHSMGRPKNSNQSGSTNA